MTTSEESFFASKTMILVMMTMGVIVSLVIVGIAVKIAFHMDVFSEVTAGIAGVTGQSASGTLRNIKTDTPQRLADVGILPTAVPPPQVTTPSF